MNFTLNGEKKPYLKDLHKTSDYSTGSDTCTYSKLSKNKYLDSNSKEGFSSSAESKMDFSKNKVKNKIEVGDSGMFGRNRSKNSKKNRSPPKAAPGVITRYFQNTFRTLRTPELFVLVLGMYKL